MSTHKQRDTVKKSKQINVVSGINIHVMHNIYYMYNNIKKYIIEAGNITINVSHLGLLQGMNNLYFTLA